MPSFNYDGELVWFLVWNVAAFVGSFVPHSFAEWFAHRWILHSRAIVRFAYEEHDQEHHYEYLADASFSVPGKDYGVDFGVRDWLLFMVFLLPVWAGVEYLVGKPLLVGVALAMCLWLQMFNVLHRHYHAPTGSWIERTWYFNYLKEHHRQHHRNPKSNLNVAFFPIADVVLGTFRGTRARVR